MFKYNIYFALFYQKIRGIILLCELYILYSYVTNFRFQRRNFMEKFQLEKLDSIEI